MWNGSSTLSVGSGSVFRSPRQPDEVVDAAVRIAGDVADGRVRHRRVEQARQRQHREHLAERPRVRHALEDREVAHEPRRGQLLERAELGLGCVVPVPDLQRLDADVGVERLAGGAVFERHEPELEARDEVDVQRAAVLDELAAVGRLQLVERRLELAHLVAGVFPDDDGLRPQACAR